jgi:very-short-patch-repair endonuclease
MNGNWKVLAATQAGVITSTQLAAAGWTRRGQERLVQDGVLARAGKGLFTVIGAGDLPPAARWSQRLWLLVLCAGPAAVAFRRSAGGWWRLDGVPAGIVEAAVAPGHQSRSKSVHRLSTLVDEHVTVERGLPVTTVARTLVDLGSAVPDGVVERALECALRRRLVTVDEMVALMDGLRCRGRSALARVLVQRPVGAPATESDAETLFLQAVRSCGLPEPLRQFGVLLEERLYHLDFAWPALRLAVEIDGFEVHGHRRALQRDLRRQNRIQLDGWLILRFTWDDVMYQPRDVVAVHLREAWQLRGGIVAVR